MARPRIYEEERVATAVRLPVSVHEELHRLARARDVSVNYLITRAVEELLACSPGPAEGTGLFSQLKKLEQSV
jgi:predicted DNA-binding ribbon-helix-helix protein